MPYINPKKRPPIDKLVEKLLPLIKDEGHLNYAITRLAHRCLETDYSQGRLANFIVPYVKRSHMHGALQDVASEFYAAVMVPYERGKRRQNGPVSSMDADIALDDVKQAVNGLSVEQLVLDRLRQHVVITKRGKVQVKP